ncbi:hypothetical protein [Lactobacillus intestinalis]|uniref:hypothetical protein n=1 Tax=Lactobacillus intestinalis TaxID=151781 RepID=UPI0025AA1DDC|nr:hypothetical protein [Lactobacillus intestinalis]
MKIILEAMKANLQEMNREDLDYETRAFIANSQIKLAEAFIQMLHAEDSKKYPWRTKNHSKKSDLKD